MKPIGHIRKWLTSIITFGVLLCSCQRYNDSAIWDKLQEHEERIARLEKLCNELNSNISALEDIVTAIQNYDYVTGITSLTENGEKTGYTITFSKSGSVDIYHGKNGAPGEPGQDGADGADGKDGHTPVIGVKKDADGIYYWTLDGEWITDSEGNKIPTTGKDGANGQPGAPGADGQLGQDGENGTDGEQGKPGQDGKDGITPLLKIEDDYWYISYDNGQRWQQLYKAVGEDGAAGADGTDGAPGKDGQSFFQSVDTTNPNYIILTLADGSQIKIPTWKAFEELQTKVNQINTNLAALQTILEALQNSDYVTEITTATENGKEVGYTIHFSKSQPVTIYHGKDGANGALGQDGEDGKDGADGKDGHTPVIGIRKATDEDWALDSGWLGDPTIGYYWTIDGEWLLDSEGNKVPANGQHGITPLLKIEDGTWYVSTDEGKTWKAKGPATGSNLESIFTDISYNSEYLYLTLATGETISLSRHKEKLSIACGIEPTEITDRKVTFIGHLDVQADVLPYSQITLYYSDDEAFNIYTAESISTSVFDYKNCFEFIINKLDPETQYSYCICAKVLQDEMYSPIKTFQTDTERVPENGGDTGTTDVRYSGTISSGSWKAANVSSYYKICNLNAGEKLNSIQIKFGTNDVVPKMAIVDNSGKVLYISDLNKISDGQSTTTNINYTASEAVTLCIGGASGSMGYSTVNIASGSVTMSYCDITSVGETVSFKNGVNITFSLEVTIII